MDKKTQRPTSESENPITELIEKKDGNSNQELEVHLTEYKALQDHTSSILATQRQLIGLELLVITIAISGFAVLQDQPSFLLIGALLLGILTWIMFEKTMKGQLIATYIENKLRIRIEKIVSAPVLGWDSHFTSITHRTTFYAILSLAKFMLGILLAILLLVFFWIIKRESDVDSLWTIEEIVLFVIALIIIIIPLLLGLISAFGVIRMPNKNRLSK